MSKTMSLRLTDDELAAVERHKRRYHQPSVSATLRLLLTEKLREIDHPRIVYRDTAVGRRAFLYGTRNKVWMVKMIARGYDYDIARTAKHLRVLESDIQAALDYASEFPQEIDADLAANDAMDFESLRRILPGAGETVIADDFDPPARAESAS